MRIIKSLSSEWNSIAPKEKYIHLIELSPKDHQEIMCKEEDGKHSYISEYYHGFVVIKHAKAK